MEAGKTPKGAKTKNRIIDSALKLINEKGIEKTTLVEVCAEANVAQGTFYHYFKSINDILFEVIRIEGNEMHSFMEGISSEDPKQKLYKLLDFQLEYYDKKGKAVVAHLIRNEFVPGSGESRIEKLLPLRPILAEMIFAGQEAGVFSNSDSADRIGFSIFSLIFMYAFFWIRDTSDATLKDFAGDHINDEISKLLIEK